MVGSGLVVGSGVVVVGSVEVLGSGTSSTFVEETNVVVWYRRNFFKQI